VGRGVGRKGGAGRIFRDVKVIPSTKVQTQVRGSRVW